MIFRHNSRREFAKLSEPIDPTRSGYTFGGWYQDDKTFENLWDFLTNTMPGSRMTLYAKWIENE
ncbi:InlB B-repeat-containing protein [Fusibacter paucivorans]|uniref:InlB B-repeat-containing protein n=1 Tax=Fusibacter paucivorans TaxID=76009 RepID=A0ABS5PQH1_9FIRM|nr:InlB B-repeat-containing protein [Fusibacter paucivorans]